MEVKTEDQVVVPSLEKKSLWQTLRSFGPGIVVALTALGAGDLVDSSVAGSHYGYDLMWVLAVAVLIRFVIVNIMARIDLCNNEGMTLIEGFGKLNKYYPYLFVVAGILMGHLQNSYMIKGAAESLRNMFGFGITWVWAIVVVGVSLFTLGKNVYNTLENVMKVLLGTMTLGFIGLAIGTKPDVGAMIKGTLGFGMPEGTGIFGLAILFMSLIGAVAGFLTNFLYPRFIRSKGWVGPSYKRLQRNDLLFGLGMMVLINLAIWVVGAQLLRPQGIEVKDLADISKALSSSFGGIGSVIFYLGVFGALWSSILGIAVGFTSIVLENLAIIKGEPRIADGKYENHPYYKPIVLFILITPVIWSLPGMPSFVALVTTILQEL